MDELETVIRGRLCVRAWLGYAQRLFLGFGDEVLPPVSSEPDNPRPPYELHTVFSDWGVKEQSEVCDALSAAEGDAVAGRRH